MKAASASSTVTPFEEIPRDDWARLSQQTPLPLSQDDVVRLRGLGDRIDLQEVDAVYRPISRLLNLQVAAAQSLRRDREGFLAQPQQRTPYIIGVAGSVAVGKSTTARLLRELMARWPETPRVQLVTTDGFLLPECRAREPRDHAPQGLPRELRPPQAAALRLRREVRAGQGRGSRLLAPDLRHPEGREGGRRAARRAHPRGAERAAAGTPPPRRATGHGGLGLLRLLDLRRWPCRGRAALVRGSVPAAAPYSLLRSAILLPPLRRPHRRGGRADRAADLGAPSTAPTSPRTCCPTAAAPISCCARTASTACTPCCCARSELLRTV